MKRAGALAKLANHLAKRHPDFAAVGVCNWLDLPTAARAARAALGLIFLSLIHI